MGDSSGGSGPSHRGPATRRADHVRHVVLALAPDDPRVLESSRMGSAPDLLGPRRPSSARSRLCLGARAQRARRGPARSPANPGIGKTALLEAATAELPGMRPAEGRRLRGRVDHPVRRGPAARRSRCGSTCRRSPERHQQALRVAAGCRVRSATGPVPGRPRACSACWPRPARRQPVVCAVDDAHLLDAESLDALAFVARRLEAESVALRVREPRRARTSTAQMAGRARHSRLDGLAPEPAIRLLLSVLPETHRPGGWPPRSRRPTGGNPLALVDLAERAERHAAHRVEPRRRTDPGRTPPRGVLRPPGPPPRRRTSQLWLLIAAADSTGDLDLIRPPAEGARAARGAPATEPRRPVWSSSAVTVRFRHPLVRSAAYNAAPGADRRRVHAGPGAAAADLGLVEREAWHAAKATLGTDAGGRRPAGARWPTWPVSAVGSHPAPACWPRPQRSPRPGPRKHARLVGRRRGGAGRPAPRSSPKTLLDEVDEDLLDPRLAGRHDRDCGPASRCSRRTRRCAHGAPTCSRPRRASTARTPSSSRTP